MVASGNIIQKDYGLVMGEMENNPYKIAEVLIFEISKH